jgi:hypothetical protein
VCKLALAERETEARSLGDGRPRFGTQTGPGLMGPWRLDSLSVVGPLT